MRRINKSKQSIHFCPNVLSIAISHICSRTFSGSQMLTCLRLCVQNSNGKNVGKTHKTTDLICSFYTTKRISIFFTSRFPIFSSFVLPLCIVFLLKWYMGFIFDLKCCSFVQFHFNYCCYCCCF